MSGFVQIIEWKTSKMDEMRAYQEEWRAGRPEMGPKRFMICEDRDNAGTYLTVVEFESYEAAMKNSEDPATSEFAEHMQTLSDGPPTFRNLDLLTMEER